MKEPRLMRSETERVFAGVCGGIAVYLAVDPVFVRLAFVLLAFASGIGFLAYLLLLVLMPAESNVHKSAGEIFQDNLNSLGDTLANSVTTAQAHPQGRNIAALLLIGIGLYFLLESLGWFGWLNALVWPILLIGIGVLLLRRNR